MVKAAKHTAFASLDIGTSQVKLGVYCPTISDKIILINNLENELIYGSSGEVRADYKVIREKCFALFRELSKFLRSNGIEVLYIGICGHISSLVEWNRIKNFPPEEPFPIWLDTTSYGSIGEYNEVMGNGRSKDIIGTFLPAGTNWLFTKLLHRRQSGISNNSIFLQAGDGIFFDLCAKYRTHFSSQLSMVDLKKRCYAPALLDHLNLDNSFFPLIDENPCPILPHIKKLFDFPQESFAYPAMADLYPSLYGLRLEDKEGFMLANTSEQAGVYYNEPPKALNNFLSISFDKGFINYGSTNTGGNIVNWFLNNVMKQKATPALLDELTTGAAAVEPADTPIILPYLQGERAPLWNSRLTASILELTSVHTAAHLFRAILESIAFARKQCFDTLGSDDLDLIKLAGGSSKNRLWNSIRATVLNKCVSVADEKELSMAGIIYYLMEATASSFSKPAIHFTSVMPDPDRIAIYEEKYLRFIKYQQLLH